jgi:hypothetical protein
MSAVYAWDVVCTSWRPAAWGGDRLGYVDLVLAGGLSINDVRVIRQATGGIQCMFPRQYRKAQRPECENLPRPCVSFARPCDWIAFTDAAVKAVRAAYPLALPPDHETTATLAGASLAVPTTE